MGSVAAWVDGLTGGSEGGCRPRLRSFNGDISAI